MEGVIDTTTTRAIATGTILIHQAQAAITGPIGEMTMERTNTQEATNTQAPTMAANELVLVGDCFVLVGCRET